VGWRFAGPGLVPVWVPAGSFGAAHVASTQTRLPDKPLVLNTCTIEGKFYSCKLHASKTFDLFLRRPSDTTQLVRSSLLAGELRTFQQLCKRMR
jgi:hypothetical protein